MKKEILTLLLPLILLISGNAQTARFVAVTIDDLPVVVKNSDLKKRQQITTKLLRQITKEKIPAIGFVNENKLYTDEKLIDAEVALLQQWIDAGLTLGNHTFSHLSLNKNPLEKYEAEILKGEIVSRKLMATKGNEIRYFRHPFLNTGLSLEIKAGLDKFLAEHGYVIAPVTIDNSDWVFARAYDNAIEKNDKRLKSAIGKSYVPYLEAKTEYWERQSKKILGYEIKQTLLLHANSINADYFDGVAKMYKSRGYKFITLEEALKDKAYKLPDTFVRNAGISWLHRWALEMGRENILPTEPKVPDFVMKAAGVDSE